MEQLVKKLFTILTAMIFATSAAADLTGLFSMRSMEDGRKWEAVGRLEISGSAFCTGALIAPNLVLTAAHCLYDPQTGARVPTDEIQFLAGWREGRASAYRYVRRAVHHPDYDYNAQSDSSKVRNDIALLELQHPIRNTQIVPFETDLQPERGDRLGAVSYAFDRSEAPALQETCRVLSRQEGIVVMTCEVDFGSSGSPVFSFESGTPKIVSVISAKAHSEGKPVSLGTSLHPALNMLKVQLSSGAGFAHSSAPERNRTSVGLRKDTGAKFIKSQE